MKNMWKDRIEKQIKFKSEKEVKQSILEEINKSEINGHLEEEYERKKTPCIFVIIIRSC